MRRKSFIVKLFIYMAVLLTLIGLGIGYCVYQYAYKTIATEVGQFSKARMEKASNEIGDVIIEEVYLSERIAYNSEVIECLGENKPLDEVIDTILNDYMWLKNENRHRLIDVYVVQGDEVVYTNSRQARSLNIKIDRTHNNEDIIITDTMKDETGTGIYQHVFQIIKPIRDHLTQEDLGSVVLNVTEKVLCDAYQYMRNNTRDYLIVNDEGNIISAKDKRKIGTPYIGADEVEVMPAGYSNWSVYTRLEDQSIITYTRIPGTTWYLIEELDADEYMTPLINIKTQSFACLIIFIILSMVVLKQFAEKLIEPVDYIKDQMALVTQGHLKSYIQPIRKDEFGEIALSFNEMLDTINNLLDEVKSTEQKKRLAELDFLRAQINPHFIYNTLSSIRFLIEMEKNEDAEDMLFYFSKILRSTLSNSNQYILIREELETIENYVNLQKIRYPGSFEIFYEVDESIMEEKIINFILQPIIENSIFYSNQKKDEICKIIVTGERKGKLIELSIADNGIGMSKKQVQKVLNKADKMNSIGIMNVHERIQLHYGKDYGLEILGKEGEGVKVIFRLPGK